MTALRLTLRNLALQLRRAIRRHHLRARIAQLEALQARPDLHANSDYVRLGLLDAKLAELRCELYGMEAYP